MVNFALVFILLLAFQPLIINSTASPATYIYGRVLDANTGSPIENATIMVWDLVTLEKPRLGVGIYLTDKNGEYNISGSLRFDHTYWIYAFKGDFAAKTVDYVPTVKRIEKLSSDAIGGMNISFSLIPGALIEFEGIPYIVQSSSPGGGRIFINVLNETELKAPFINEYGDSNDAWFLGLSKELVIIPANIPVTLEANSYFFLKEQSRIGKEPFRIYNGSSPFLVPQGYKATSQISTYSLRDGVNFVETKLKEITEELNEAQRIGFVVFEDRSSIIVGQQRKNDASMLLARAQNDTDYRNAWVILREVVVTTELVSKTLQNMRLIAKTSAVYLSGIMATFSVVLAFFFFEDRNKKIISSVVIYFLFLLIMYFSYPGTHIIIDENALLFLESVGVSFLVVSAIVFGLPLVWKERNVEGEVSARSAMSIIFSMGKRQIRRKKIRGFFTILSMIILILAFTSLTSFGTVFGIVSERLNRTAPSDGVMVKRTLNATSLLFSPLGSDDPSIISGIVRINNIALRLKNIPSSNPVARLVNPGTGRNWLVYGILGIAPTNESLYTALEDTVVVGSYLSDIRDDEILIGRTTAERLNIGVNENLTLRVLDSEVSGNFIVKGIVDDGRYTNLVDMDGASYGPARLLSDGSPRICNSTEVVIMSQRAADKLQRLANALEPEGAPQFAVLSDIVFQLGSGVDLSPIVRTLVFVFNYDVFTSSNNNIIYYHIGSYYEVKGIAEVLIPLVMVGLNVGMVMLNAVYERRKEIQTLSMLGLNPTHIGLIFVAEAIVIGMVGGSLGYLFGLGFYRVTVLFGQELMVREKLEWWWSAIGFAIALVASVLSAIRPAALAISTYTPSKVRKIKMPEEEAKARKEEIFKVFQARELSMPVKVALNEKVFFIGYFLDRLHELKMGYLEKVGNVEDKPEIENVKGELVKEIKFEYRFEVSGVERRTKNNLVLIKSPQEDYYRVKIVSEPAVPGMPGDSVERTIDFVLNISLAWARDKAKIMGI